MVFGSFGSSTIGVSQFRRVDTVPFEIVLFVTGCGPSLRREQDPYCEHP